MWKLWLDDQINDPNTQARWVPVGMIGAESTARAIELVNELGVPGFIDLDHDLGGDDTAKVFLKWLSANYPNGPVPEYNIHSANGPGAEWLASYLDSWKRSLE